MAFTYVLINFPRNNIFICVHDKLAPDWLLKCLNQSILSKLLMTSNFITSRKWLKRPVMDDFLGWLSWITFMDDCHGFYLLIRFLVFRCLAHFPNASTLVWNPHFSAYCPRQPPSSEKYWTKKREFIAVQYLPIIAFCNFFNPEYYSKM